mgnify:CR=1 FL=1|jgi:sec-independent protein translocase protein TatA
MFGGDEWLIIVIIALVVFGSAKLPSLAKNLGEAQRELKRSMREGAADDEDDAATTIAEESERADAPNAIEAPTSTAPTPTEVTSAEVASMSDASKSEVNQPPVG